MLHRLIFVALLIGLPGCDLFGDGGRALDQASKAVAEASPFACFALQDEGSIQACLIAAEEAELAPCRAILHSCAVAVGDEHDACIARAAACGEEVGGRYDAAWMALTGSTER